MRRFSERNSLVTLSDINITPLLDLAFVLLIIFMITTPLLEQGMSLNLPTGGRSDKEKLEQALVKLVDEDPTLRVREDVETGQTLISGMGELHLDIVKSRLEREYGAKVRMGRPQVVYRETVRRAAEANLRTLDGETRRHLEAYAAGVNAFLATDPVLPVPARRWSG